MADQNIKVKIDLDVAEFNKSAKQLSDAISKVLGKDVDLFNGKIRQTAQQVDNAAKSMNNATKSFNDIGSSANKAGQNVKQSSKQWTSLALVVQDLPYGFRGIQNNLPAVFGSIASAAGPAYLAFSALVAITTAYEKEIVKLIYGLDDLDEANKKMNETVADNIGNAKSQIASDQSLLKIINDTTKSTDTRKRALNQLKEEYKGNIELQKLDITDGNKLATVYNKISDALLRKARATAYASLIAEEEAKIFKLQTQEGEEVVKNLGFIGTTYGLLTSGLGGFNAAANIATAAFSKQSKQITQSQAKIALFTEKMNENTAAQIENADASSLDNTKPAKVSDKDAKEAAKLAAFAAKRVAKAGGDIEVIIEPEIDPKAQAKAFNDKMAFDKKMSKERVDLLKEQYQIEVSEAQGSFDQIKIAEENMRNALNQGFMDGSIKLDEYLTAINDLRKKSNKTVLDESKAAMQDMLKMGIGIMNALGPALDMLLEKGASIGEVLSKALNDVIKKLIKVAIAAAIAVALLSLIFPSTVAKAGGAGKMFGNLIGGGMGLGTQLFANGGIVSGPTMGLVGEYPGAQSNPEVIAPLDKLKSMIGGGNGSGEFVLRGQDLVLAMTRSNNSLNLRR